MQNDIKIKEYEDAFDSHIQYFEYPALVIEIKLWGQPPWVS